MVVVTASAAVAVLLMKYVQWCFYIPLVYDEYYQEYGYWEFNDFVSILTVSEQLELAAYYFIDPASVYALVLDVNEYGVWALSQRSESNMTGIMLWVVWAGELAILAASALVIARLRPGLPFCEETNEWYTAMKGTFETDVPNNPDGLVLHMERGDMSELVSLAVAGVTDPSNYIRLRFFLPPRSAPPNTLNYVDIEYVTVQQQKKKSAAKVVKLAKYIAINDADMTSIINRAGAGL
jgi:hypothetical protein